MNPPVEPLTNEGCFFFEDHVVHTEHTGVTVEDGKAKAVAADLGPGAPQHPRRRQGR